MALSRKDVIEQVDAAFARNDIEGFLSFCDDDFVLTMVGSDPVKGKDAIRQWMASGPPEPPHFTANTVVAEGDFVTSIGDMTMTENGTVVPYSYCDVWRFRGDKLVELRAFVIKTAGATV
ncbi:MAG TPA: nuclear transport factor 2 family protein [Vicinamibacterales bacterium]|nr:nuclear transport factor 2 family protein [Vicinamibacterales bacterium]